MNSFSSFLSEFSPDADRETLLRVRLFIDGDYDPQLSARILARVSERNRLPARILVLADEIAASMRIELEFEASADSVRQLARRLMGIPSVRDISVALRPLQSDLSQRHAA